MEVRDGLVAIHIQFGIQLGIYRHEQQITISRCPFSYFGDRSLMEGSGAEVQVIIKVKLTASVIQEENCSSKVHYTPNSSQV